MTSKSILITGAAGFLGGRAAKYFGHKSLEYHVLCTSRRSDNKVDVEDAGCMFVAGDLQDVDFCNSLTKNIDVVVHCAALSSPWGKYQDFYNANVQVTKNLIAAAKANQVKTFVHISTPSIYFNNTNRFKVREDEALPNPLVNHYARTKLISEEFVLNQNTDDFLTLALRPRAIIGAEDTVIMPRLIQAHEKGKLRRMGNGKTVCDLTSVRNVIEAIELSIHADKQAYGLAYNISNDEPVVLWDKIDRMFASLNMSPIVKKIPEVLVLNLASLIEFKHKLFNQTGEPTMTRYGLATLTKSLTMDITRAKLLLQYKPVQTTDEGLEEFATWYKTKK